jgi:hypothetical protein
MKQCVLALGLVSLLALGAYAASPFIALYHMGQAMRHGDAASLCADVSWNEVREGLKEDIADGITGEPGATDVASNNDDLPAFGASFVTGIAGNVVDRTVTPQHMVVALATLRKAGVVSRPSILFAHFTSPVSFEVAFRLPEERPSDSPVRLRLHFVTGPEGAGWVVTRAWLPESLLTQSDTHTS